MAISFYAGSSYQLLQLKRWLIVGFKRRYLKTASLSLTPEMANQMYPYWLLVCYQTYRLLAKNPDIPFLFSWWYRWFVNSNYCCLENCGRSQHFILQRTTKFTSFYGLSNFWLCAINPLTPVSTCIFSSLLSIFFLKYQLGEFAQTSRRFMLGDHFLYSHDLYVRSSWDILRRN